jgi:hypothetical protein
MKHSINVLAAVTVSTAFASIVALAGREGLHARPVTNGK